MRAEILEERNGARGQERLRAAAQKCGSEYLLRPAREKDAQVALLGEFAEVCCMDRIMLLMHSRGTISRAIVELVFELTANRTVMEGRWR